MTVWVYLLAVRGSPVHPLSLAVKLLGCVKNGLFNPLRYPTLTVPSDQEIQINELLIDGDAAEAYARLDAKQKVRSGSVVADALGYGTRFSPQVTRVLFSVVSWAMTFEGMHPGKAQVNLRHPNDSKTVKNRMVRPSIPHRDLRAWIDGESALDVYNEIVAGADKLYTTTKRSMLSGRCGAVVVLTIKGSPDLATGFWADTVAKGGSGIPEWMRAKLGEPIPSAVSRAHSYKGRVATGGWNAFVQDRSPKAVPADGAKIVGTTPAATYA